MKLLSIIGILGLSACSPAPRQHMSTPSSGPVEKPSAAAAMMADAPPIFSDFPADPIVEIAATAVSGFSLSAAAGAGPCVIEPEAGTLFPQNWLRPRFRFAAPGGAKAFEIRLHAANQRNDLVVYTAKNPWTLPADLWSNLALNSSDLPIEFSIRSGTLNGASVTGVSSAVSGIFTIAPAPAGGTIVYWTSSGGGKLRGFEVGDESVYDVLTPAKAGTQCISCHSSTPDGKYVGFSASDNGGDGVPASVGLRSLDGTASTPPFLSQAAAALLARKYQWLPVFSPAYWSAGNHVAFSIFAGDTHLDSAQLIWTDLEATSQAVDVGWGIIKRDGDLNPAGMAQVSHDGTMIVYESAPTISSGGAYDGSEGDLYIVPFSGKAGGTVRAVWGASDPGANESYPSFSPDDKYISFNRAPIGRSNLSNPDSEIYIVETRGSLPTRLQANDPPLCMGKSSPGINNSWPKWSPAAGLSKGRRYYFLTFSSSRENGIPQLYLAPVVVDEAAEVPTVASFPALYLWNQPADEHNHSPAWDVFDVIQ